MAINKARKAELVKEFGKNGKDSGAASPNCYTNRRN